MLPNRPRLQRWNPGSLTTTATGVTKSGSTVNDSVVGIEHAVTNMQETNDWTGPAHDAAVAMFGRASKKAQDFSDYAGGIATALSRGAESIGTARTNLLNKATEIEQGGELYVNDQWVVLIKPAEMSAEQAANLEKKAQAEQVNVNALLLAVGAADDTTAQAVQAAAQEHRYTPPTGLLPAVLLAPPGDEVPNPSTFLGFMQQSTIRDHDMAMTVRDKKVDESQRGITTTTLTMQDGGKHVITVDREFDQAHKGPITTDVYYDKNGEFISRTGSFQPRDRSTGELNGRYTSVTLADGTMIQMHESANGMRSGEVTKPNGQSGPLPDKFFQAAEVFFSEPVQDSLGIGLSGLEQAAGNPAIGIPTLSPSSLSAVEAGAKYGGPALGVVATLYNTLTADSQHEACVEAYKGTFGTVGGVATGWTLQALAPELPGIAYVVGGYAGGKLAEALGEFVGDAVCTG